MTNKSKIISKKLTSVHPSGKPVENEKTVYTLLNASELAYDASVALDNEKEETFSKDVSVSSVLNGEEIVEIYTARFTRHASWGLKAEIDTDEHGKFALWLEFARDGY